MGDKARLPESGWLRSWIRAISRRGLTAPPSQSRVRTIIAMASQVTTLNFGLDFILLHLLQVQLALADEMAM